MQYFKNLTILQYQLQYMMIYFQKAHLKKKRVLSKMINRLEPVLILKQKQIRI